MIDRNDLIEALRPLAAQLDATGRIMVTVAEDCGCDSPASCGACNRSGLVMEGLTMFRDGPSHEQQAGN